MKAGIALLLLPLIAAAAPAPRPLPIPPIPPPQPPALEPAPIPDRDVIPPATQEATGPRFKPRLLRVPTYQNQFDPSAGYVGGSRLQEDQTDRKLAPSPGFILEIPLR